MKHLSTLSKSSLLCGTLVSAALMASCESPTLATDKAVQRLERSPITSVFSHNDVNSPRLRDCYEAGPLPERAERALITWLHNSTLQDFSYVYPQYYITTTNPQGGGEVVWALCSDGQGHLVGVLVPSSKRTPAWELPTIGGYKLLVCDTPEREALSNAIMESLADAGYDKVRIDTRKAGGLAEKAYLLSKPMNAEEEMQLQRERRERAQAAEAAKKKRKAEAAAVGDSSADDDDSSDASSESDTPEPSAPEADDDLPTPSDDDDSSDASSSDDSSSSDDDSDSSSDDDSSDDSSSDDELDLDD